ncbi:MAG: hypothetical protein A2776_01295 [Candidatus Levybacteria bacterium RIFCSPHIGHO2_01_FULL_40_10]|nr:MAG: hypothetical protein A2776_01295 [Candidatus Levybacteria bacterium RIFCSPHIGHO2_01_FULL_40_10]
MQSQLAGLPIIKPFIKTINSDVKKFGLQKAMMNTVIRSGTNLIVKGKSSKVEHVLKNEAVVLVANHPHEVDIIALFAALSPREDTSLIISFRFMNLVPHADPYLIPVYTEHHAIKAGEEKLKRKFFRKLHNVPTFSPEEEHKKNIESIKFASEKVERGEMVVIFPNPSKDQRRSWYSGVGHMLHGVNRRKKVYVVKAYIEGTSNFDYLRLFPHAAKLLTPIKVTFSQPQNVETILKNDPKEITRILEDDYRKWEEKVSSKPRELPELLKAPVLLRTKFAPLFVERFFERKTNW